ILANSDWKCALSSERTTLTAVCPLRRAPFDPTPTAALAAAVRADLDVLRFTVAMRSLIFQQVVTLRRNSQGVVRRCLAASFLGRFESSARGIALDAKTAPMMTVGRRRL